MHLRDFEDFPTALTYVKEVDENKNKKTKRNMNENVWNHRMI